jgi:hypothetical protein
MRKDLSICLAEAWRNGASVLVTALVEKWTASAGTLPACWPRLER